MLLLLILVVFYLLDKSKFNRGVLLSLKRDWKIFPVFALALIISYYIGVIFERLNINMFLTNNNIINAIVGTLLGFIFPGPRYIIYAFIPQFITLGFTITFIVSLLFSQQLLIQPDGTVLQVKYFGWFFSIVYTIIMVVLIIVITMLMKNLYILNINLSVIKHTYISQTFVNFLTNALFDYLPILFLAVCLSGVINEWVEIKPNMFKSNILLVLFISSILGILTPGPIYEIYPLMGVLKRKGVPLYVITSFITGQASMGPIRIVLEIKMLGLSFVVVRIIEALIISILSGLIIKVIYLFRGVGDV